MHAELPQQALVRLGQRRGQILQSLVPGLHLEPLVPRDRHDRPARGPEQPPSDHGMAQRRARVDREMERPIHLDGDEPSLSDHGNVDREQVPGDEVLDAMADAKPAEALADVQMKSAELSRRLL